MKAPPKKVLKLFVRKHLEKIGIYSDEMTI